MIDFPLIVESLPSLLKATMLSVKIATLSACIGMGLGLVVGTLDSLKNPFLNPFIRLYVTIFRGTPMLVQILFAYYVLPQVGVEIEAQWTAILAIGLNSAAYISQTVRSGINSVPPGQIEAASTLGLSSWQVTRDIVYPQAFRVILPALGNEFITLVKDSSLASIIGVVELSKSGSIIRSHTYDAFSILLAVACIYLTMTALLSFMIEKIEKRMSHA